jgi:hypothetical protein
MACCDPDPIESDCEALAGLLAEVAQAAGFQGDLNRGLLEHVAGTAKANARVRKLLLSRTGLIGAHIVFVTDVLRALDPS